MALLSLIFGGPTRAQIGVMLLDAAISERHVRDAKITRNEIEDGSLVSDHVKLEPIKLTIEGIVSDSPLDFIGAALGTVVGLGTSAVQNAFKGGSSFLGSVAAQTASLGLGSLSGLVQETSGTLEERVQGRIRDPIDAFKYLEELWQKREPFTVITKLNRYENMVIANLTVPRDARTGKSLRFTLTLEEVRTVTTSIIDVAAFQVDNRSGESQANNGKQSTKDAKEATSNKTIALTIAQSAGILPGDAPVFVLAQ